MSPHFDAHLVAPFSPSEGERKYTGASLGDGTLVKFCIDATDWKRAEQALHESEQQLAVELGTMQRLQGVSTRLIQANNVHALYQQILDAAMALMQVDMASIQLLDYEKNALRLLAYHGFAPASEAFWEWVEPHSSSASTCGMALHAGERVVVEDVDAYRPIIGTPDHDAYPQSGIRAVQSTPLVSRSGKVLGVISTHWRQPHAPSEREFRLLDVLARQAADLLERTQHEQALREADRRKDEFLAMLSHEIRNPLAPIRRAIGLLRLSPADPSIQQEVLEILDRQMNVITHSSMTCWTSLASREGPSSCTTPTST
jgi:GAF domain-containing protein